jgi:hypothetical protein
VKGDVGVAPIACDSHKNCIKIAVGNPDDKRKFDTWVTRENIKMKGNRIREYELDSCVSENWLVAVSCQLGYESQMFLSRLLMV